MKHLRCVESILLLLLLSLVHTISEDAPQLIKYELVETVQGYTYESSQHQDEVITSKENAFSITVLEDVPVLRKGMLQITPDTYYFWMDGRNLSEIEPGAFDNQNITVEIRLEGNKLTVIRTGTFKNLKITQLGLTYNKITHIEENAITDMPNLSLVYLSRNEIVQFHDNSFVNTPNMWAFDMSYNKLTKLGENWFGFMKKDEAVIVGVAHNEIEEIHTKAFKGINVWNLGLEHNKLKSIPEEIFMENDIRMLGLENNQLETLPEAFFKQKNLTDVTLRSNPLKCGVQEQLKKLAEDTKAAIFYDTKSCL